MADPTKATKTKLSAKVEAAGKTIDEADIWNLSIESGLNLADQCLLTLTKSGTDKHAKRIADAKRQDLTVLLAHEGDAMDIAFVGEVTAHGPAADQAEDSGGTTEIEGLNAAAGLALGHRACTYTKGETGVTLKEVIEQVLQRHSELKLSVDFGGNEPTIKYKHLYQAGENDFAFICRLADEEGYTVLVRDKKLLVHKWTKEDSGLKLKTKTVRKTGDDKGVIVLSSFNPVASTTGQVTEVRLRCYQAAQRQELLVIAKSEGGGQGGGSSRTGASATSAKYKGTAVHFSDIYFSSKEEGKQKAEACLERLRRSYVTGSGDCPGDPRLKPGLLVEITDTDPNFSGKYHITSVKHWYRHGGDDSSFTTEFTVCRAALEETKKK